MKNIITLYSADNKVGTTMLCQSAAEMLAKLNPEKKILIAHFDGNPGIDYTRKHQYCLDDVRLQLISDVIGAEDLLTICVKDNNLYSLKGCNDNLAKKLYQPENVKKIFDIIKNNFDIILVDAGHSENGLTIGSLLYSHNNLLVVTQQKTVHSKFISMDEQIFRSLSIKFEGLIVNKFSYSMGTFLPTEKEIANMYGFDDCEINTIEMSNYAWQAEHDKISLIAYKEKNIIQGVVALANKILALTENIDDNHKPVKGKKLNIFRRRDQVNAAG